MIGNIRVAKARTDVAIALPNHYAVLIRNRLAVVDNSDIFNHPMSSTGDGRSFTICRSGDRGPAQRTAGHDDGCARSSQRESKRQQIDGSASGRLDSRMRQHDSPFGDLPVRQKNRSRIAAPFTAERHCLDGNSGVSVDSGGLSRLAEFVLGKGDWGRKKGSGEKSQAHAHKGTSSLIMSELPVQKSTSLIPPG